MKRLTFIFFIVLFFFNNKFLAQTVNQNAQREDASIKIYIAKSYWHTGYILYNDSLAQEHLPVLKNFDSFELVDIGMGEREFYMDPSYDLFLAAKAILYPTEGTVRIAGVPGNIDDLIRWRDYVVELELTGVQFEKLCEFIEESLIMDEFFIPVIIEKRAEGSIVFYESPQSYHLFNTCNTWLASGLRFANLDEIKPFNVITSQNLFEELIKYGEVLKLDTSDSIF